MHPFEDDVRYNSRVQVVRAGTGGVLGKVTLLLSSSERIEVVSFVKAKAGSHVYSIQQNRDKDVHRTKVSVEQIIVLG